MPTKTKTAKPKASTKKSVAKKSSVIKSKTKKKKPAKKEEVVSTPKQNVCRTCNVLPIGSVELTSLLLVLVFSLSAVLFTAVTAYGVQQQHITNLEHQLAIRK